MSNFLYQNHGSSEVIARLLKELKAAREAYDSLEIQYPTSKASKLASNERTVMGEQSTVAPDVVDLSLMNGQDEAAAGLLGLTAEFIDETKAKSKVLSSARGRRKRHPDPEYILPEDIAKFKIRNIVTGIHSPSVPGITKILNLEDTNAVLTAGNDGHVKAYSFDKSKIVADFKAHSKPVSHISFFGPDRVVLYI